MELTRHQPEAAKLPPQGDPLWDAEASHKMGAPLEDPFEGAVDASDNDIEARKIEETLAALESAARGKGETPPLPNQKPADRPAAAA